MWVNCRPLEWVIRVGDYQDDSPDVAAQSEPDLIQ